MNRLRRHRTFHCLLIVLPCLILCVASKAQAQVTVSQGDCSEHSPCTSMAHPQEANVSQLDIQGTPLIGPGQVTIVSTAGMAGLQDKAAVVKNEPYQAQAVTEMKQTLADGSHIVQTTTATVARDSDGRTMRVQKLSTMGPWRSADSSPGNSPTLTTIFDPVAQEHIDYTSDSKIAHVFLMPSVPSGAVVRAEGGFDVAAPNSAGVMEKGLMVSGPGQVGAVTQRFALPAGPVSPQLSEAVKPKTESLGTKSMEGVQVTGTRSTSTIPTGTIGNDRDLTIIRETWYSSELKLVIQSTQSDPRFGETTYTLKNIQQGSPDVTLFQVPANYTIDKIVPRVVKATAQ
jgi:hypothetical protein